MVRSLSSVASARLRSESTAATPWVYQCSCGMSLKASIEAALDACETMETVEGGRDDEL